MKKESRITPLLENYAECTVLAIKHFQVVLFCFVLFCFTWASFNQANCSAGSSVATVTWSRLEAGNPPRSKISGLVGNLSSGSTALLLSAFKPTNFRLAGYFCAIQSCSEHDGVAGKSCIHCFPPGTREEQRRPIYHSVSVPVLYREVHSLRGDLNSANNHYWDRHRHYRRSCHFHGIPLQFIQCTLRHKVFHRIWCHYVVQQNVLGDVLITEKED